MTIGLLLSVSAFCLLTGILLGRRAPGFWLGLTLLAALAALGACGQVLLGGAEWDWRSAFRVGGESVHLRLDAVSAWFLTLLSVVGGAAAVYTRDYWSDHHYPRSAARNRAWWNVLLLTMGSVLVCANGLHFLIAWELFAISGYFLVTLERQDREVRAAGWLYLAASHAGTLCLFAFFTLLAARVGSWDLGPLRDRPELAPLFWLVLAGFGVKAGLFPLHIWLPSAHANAPSHVSAILSGVALKLGIYGIVRFSGWLPVPDAAGWVVIGVGAVTGLLGIAFSLAQNDLKRLLAYSSVENIGIILVGIGGGLLGLTHGDAAWGRLAFAGALLHVWNHGFFKSLLFFSAGSVLHATGTRDMSRLGGLWRAMPWTAALFATGAIAVCALPPLNGFASEWLVYLGLFDAVTSRTAAAAIATPAIILLAVTGALALVSFVKASATVFLGAPRTAIARHAHEAGPWMRGPMLLLAALCVTIGLAPVLVWPLLTRVTGVWHPGWSGAAVESPFLGLGFAPLLIASLIVGVVLLVRRTVRVRGSERQLTWDCGYALPTARMQYTGGSFGGIAAGWFNWILRPYRRLRRPRGFFPAEASLIERVPETVLEHGIQPVGTIILRISTAVRRLQHGHLQYYIAYVVVGLLGLAALVAAGVKP
ncbi:proton-conducting transporter membrane subunit [Opitutus sp. ER46]|uniref:proton-conducting transporter transmembrane domain-containing protein n=1 Tax=Opitutus sp. ER46 TaxID=2161864 RepID=UPI000D31AF14|nr:proton-conducting transporter membrane subunit [Opitutus sp. ER46]PTX90827.1 NADH-quinone oxidoreductase subunit H [Opitutus sp. ER46]